MKRTLEEQGSAHYNHYGAQGLDEYVNHRFVSEPAEAERFQTLIDMVPSDVSSVLDVGAGFGVFIHLLRDQRKLEVAGVDISDQRIAWGLARDLKMVVASSHELPFPDQSFDTIVCSEVLEHLQWGVFEETLKELPRVARDSIIVSVPYDERRDWVACPYCGASSNPAYHHRSFKESDMAGLFPGFHLIGTQGIAEISVLRNLRPYFPTPWPSHHVCPACFFCDTREATVTRTQRVVKLKRLLRSIPFPKRPRWLAATYQRDR